MFIIEFPFKMLKMNYYILFINNNLNIRVHIKKISEEAQKMSTVETNVINVTFGFFFIISTPRENMIGIVTSRMLSNFVICISDE